MIAVIVSEHHVVDLFDAGVVDCGHDAIDVAVTGVLSAPGPAPFVANTVKE